VSRYQKGKTNLDFTETRDCEWQWHQLGHMQVCTSFQTDSQASTPPLMLGHDSEVKNSNKVLALDSQSGGNDNSFPTGQSANKEKIRFSER